MASIPMVYGLDINPIVGWSLCAIGISVFLVAAFQFFEKRNEGFVMTGLYSKVRHPQYLGIIIATLGFTVVSERPMAWIAWLTLTFIYFLLALREEEILKKKFESEIETYRRQVPFFLPLISSRISEKIPVPRSNLRRYLLVFLLYFSAAAITWFILKYSSYYPSSFYE
jgi:protein-S-isoprenylcysteine O-methyltransferase Ste14